MSHLDKIKKFIVQNFFVYQDIRKAYTILGPYVSKYKLEYIGLFFFLLLDIFLTIAFAWFLGNVTDAAVQSQYEQFTWLIPLGITFLLLSLTSTYYSIYLESVTVNAVKKELRGFLLSHVLRLPAHQIQQLRSGELITHFTNDINSILGLIGRHLLEFIRLPLIFIAVFIYMASLNLSLAVMCLFIIPLALVTGAIFGLLLRKNSRLILNLNGKMNGFLTETFQGFQVIRSFTLENKIHKKYTHHNEELYKLELKNAKLHGWFSMGSEAAGSISFIAALSLGAYFVTKDLLTIGSLLAFVNLMNHLVYPLTGLASQWGALQKSLAAMERMKEILDRSPEVKELPFYSKIPNTPISIDFEHVTFGYERNQNVISDFNLSIPSGKVVAIVGPSGAGKTTILNLLQGFYSPNSGDIKINDIPISELSQAELRSSISYVHQETFLFSGTIKENLELARPDVTEAEIIEACQHAFIHDFICSLPEQYHTEIGERGIRLSGGQKQRLSIARALLKDSPILLLDEATSALDNETEEYVQAALEKLMRNRTTIVIAHRLSTIHHADMIVVMDEGQIKQIGKHHDLIAVNGLYQSLYQKQYLNQSTIVTI